MHACIKERLCIIKFQGTYDEISIPVEGLHGSKQIGCASSHHVEQLDFQLVVRLDIQPLDKVEAAKI